MLVECEGVRLGMSALKEGIVPLLYDVSSGSEVRMSEECFLITVVNKLELEALAGKTYLRALLNMPPCLMFRQRHQILGQVIGSVKALASLI